MEKHVGWDDKYKVGHNLIDSQHKQLFDIADKLYEVAYEKDPYRDRDISLILQDLARYVNYHFSCEEELMRDNDYAGMENHCNIHNTFKTYVTTLVSDFSRGQSVDMKKLYDFVCTWLIEHIGSEDKKLAKCVPEEK
ncbi:MAG: hemerythrin family protein [Candidatus Treponema excrementipullorum]|nr:hemerythrin family protein [Candidatus Treponema excrementipullorum]